MDYVGAFGFGVILLGFGGYCATHTVDFPVYYRAATQIVRGDYEVYPATVYLHGVAIPGHTFRYAPAVAFLFVPLAFMPLEAGAFLFFALKVAAVVYVGFVVRRYMRDSTSARTLILTSLLVTGGYVLEEFHYGNFHFLAVALMVYAFDAAESGHAIRAGAALGIAIATKLTPLLLLAYFGWRRRFAVCIATLVALAILAMLPAFVVGYRTNVHLLEGFGKYALQKIDEGDNYSIRGLLLGTSLSPAAVTWTWVITVLAGVLVVVARLRHTPVSPTTRFLEFCVVLTGILLASPHTQRRYFIVLFVPVAALLALVGSGQDVPEATLIGVTLATICAIGTVFPLLFAGHRLALLYQAWSPHFLGPLVMLATLVAVAVRMDSTKPS